MTSLSMQNQFEVRTIQKLEELNNVHTFVNECITKVITLLSSTDDKSRRIFQSSILTLINLQTILSDKLKNGKEYKYQKIVVAYDLKHKVIQAVASFKPFHELDKKMYVELSNIATAYWNIDCAQNLSEKYRVRGAGTSIVESCIRFSKLIGLQGKVYLEAADSAIVFYKKFSFRYVVSPVEEKSKEEDLFSLRRTPMILQPIVS